MASRCSVRTGPRPSIATRRSAGRPTSAPPSLPTSTCMTGRSRGWRSGTSGAPRSSITRRRVRDRTMRSTCSTGSSGRSAVPRRDDLHKILLIGSGPIVIGQAAEFDYSGTQACRVLIEEGYEVVLVNSNPATIMTDPEVATTTYVEPLLPGPVTQVIERERPDALLPTLGGQTALNLAKSLQEDGTLGRYGVELIGADYDAIDRAEDRERFRETMRAAGLRVPSSVIAHSVEEALGAVEIVGLPF